MRHIDCSVGDRVIMNNNSLAMFGVKAGMIGEIVHILPDWMAQATIGVRFDSKFKSRGFNLDGKCDNGHGIYVRPGCIDLYEEESDEFQKSFMTLIGVVI